LSVSCACAHGIDHAVYGVDLGVLGSVPRQRSVRLGAMPITQLDAGRDPATFADDGGAVIADDGTAAHSGQSGVRLASDPTTRARAGVIVDGSHQGPPVRE
jgi:hypothetical protein